MLGIYARYCRRIMSDRSDVANLETTRLLSVEGIEQDKERMFPRFFEFVTTLDDLTTSVQIRELFGPLPEMLEQRIRESGAAEDDLMTRSVADRVGVGSILEAETVVIQSSCSSQGLTPLEEAENVLEGRQIPAEVVDLDDSTGGKPTSTSLFTGEIEETKSHRERQPSNDERGAGSGASVEKSISDNGMLGDEVVTDPEVFVESELL